MPRSAWLAVVVFALSAPAARAQLEPIAPSPPSDLPPGESAAPSGTPVTRDPPPKRPSLLGAPIAIQGTAPPRAAEPPRTEPPAPPRTAEPIAPAEFSDTAKPDAPRGAKFGAPVSANATGDEQPVVPVSSRQVHSSVARTAPQPSATDPVDDFLKKRSELKGEDKSRGRSWKLGDIGDRLSDVIGNRNGGWFKSDHLFDGFISPISNPFLAEDPRSITELRPLFVFQRVPSSQPDFFGGRVNFFGTQARVAFTDRWSLVFHKLGGIAVNTNNETRFRDETGFAELWLGPKYTFYRGEETGAVAAGGLQFQIPTGPKGVFQDTGSLSLVPYVSYAQNFLRDLQYGSFNGILSTGYSFSTSKARSDYYWLTAHLDFDVMNLHRFYPVAELNWFLTTTNGNSRAVGVEGRDLINFGGQAKGTGLLTGALGGRVKISESAQFGATFEIPFAGKRDIFRNRFTLDFILRY
jgi:hypothetical protein